MAGLPEVIGLLHRADWTRLSLSAEVRFEQDGDLARRRQAAVRAEAMRRLGIRPGPDGWPSAEQEPEDERGGYHRWRAALLIAPGRRYRLEYEGELRRPGRRIRRRAGLDAPAAGPGAASAARLRGRPGAAGSGPVLPGRPARRVHPGRGRAGHRLRPRRDRRDRQAAARRRRVRDEPAPPRLRPRRADRGRRDRHPAPPRGDVRGPVAHPHRADGRDDEPAGCGRPGQVRAARGQPPQPG